jgi:hypothetical protein
MRTIGRKRTIVKSACSGFAPGVTGATLFLTVAGCGATPAAANEEPTPGVVSSELSKDFSDISGTVHIRIKQCTPTGSQPAPIATCPIDTGFVLIGGGAEIIGQNSPGALLTGSWPDQGLTTWHASSKDHMYSYNHQLRAYAIGLSLSGMSSTQLRNYISYTYMTSNSSQQPSVTAEVPQNYIVIGGGAQTSTGILLTDSHPDYVQWVAGGKDHGYTQIGTVTAYAIGISTQYIPGFDGNLDVVYNQGDSSNNTWYGNTKIELVPDDWVLSAIGGTAQYNAGGRLLTWLIPFFDHPNETRPGAWVSSKDHGYTDSGYTYAYFIAIKRH